MAYSAAAIAVPPRSASVESKKRRAAARLAGLAGTSAGNRWRKLLKDLPV